MPMKKIINIFNTQNLKRNLKNVIFRFPITMLIIIAGCTLLFLELHYHNSFSDIMNNNIIIAILSLIMIFFLSIWVYLTSENENFSKLKRNISQIIPIIFWIWFFFTFNRDINHFENFVFFFLTLVWIISYLFFSPYLRNILKTKKSIFYTYFYNISVIILISSILGWILFLLGAIWIWAVDALFDLNISEEKTYWNWAILSLAFITPLFSLTQIPNKENFLENYFNENMFFSFLIKYIATPFITVYFLILYAYSIKVLSNFWDWPKWEVSWMVIWFSIFGYITYIFSYIFEEKNKFIKIFRKLFPYIVIPQVFMLFYAIYLRINQYDITINRYFVMAFGLWLLVVSIYYVLSKKKHLAFIPAILTLFTIIISIWPWSVYSLPESRQLDRLEKKLISANILKESKIIPLENYNDIDKDLSKDIYSGIDYICDFSNCEKIKNLFPVIYKKIEDKDKTEWNKRKNDDIKRYEKNIKTYKDKDKKILKNNKRLLKETLKRKYKWPNKWEIVNEITKTIKVKQHYSNQKQREYINIYIDNHKSVFPMDTKSYSKILTLNSNKYRSDNDEYGKIDVNKNSIEIIKQWKTIIEIDIKKTLEEITKKYEKNLSVRYPKKDLTFEIMQEWKKFKIIFSNIDIKNPNYKWEDKWWYYYSNGYLLY